MRRENNHKKRSGAKYLPPLLMLVCVIALCFSVGKTYAVITEATTVVVNTFYGESESGEPETEETSPEETSPEETSTEETSAEETSTEETSTEETETEAVEAETAGTGSSGTGSGETDTGEGAQTGDSSHLVIWIIVAVAAFAGIVIIGMKMLRDKKRTD